MKNVLLVWMELGFVPDLETKRFQLRFLPSVTLPTQFDHDSSTYQSLNSKLQQQDDFPSYSSSSTFSVSSPPGGFCFPIVQWKFQNLQHFLLKKKKERKKKHFLWALAFPFK